MKFKRQKTTYVVPLVLDKKNQARDYFLTSLTEAINASGGLRLVDLDESGEDFPIEDEGLQVSPEDLEIAFPKTKELPYDNVWIAIEDDLSLQAVVINDNDLLGFKHADDADFHILQLEYIEE